MSGVPAICAIEPDQLSTNEWRPSMNVSIRTHRRRSRRSRSMRWTPCSMACSTRWAPTASMAAPRTTRTGRAARRLDHAAPRTRHRGVALPAGDEPQPTGKIRLPEELPQSARLRLRPAWHRTRDQFRGRRFDAGGDWTDVACRPPISCCRRRPAIRSIRSPRRAARCRQVACASTSRPIVSAREPSRHLDRLQSFRMREYVCVGSPDDVSDFRERWMVRAKASRATSA